MLTVTAKIGQSCARSAIGLREGKFYSRYLVKRSGKIVPVSELPAAEEGIVPADAVLKKYSMYERSRYGSSLPRLTRFGILLLLYIHFQDPDQNGLVRFFEPDTAAEAIGCTRRTIMNNLHCLEHGGYISMSKAGYAGVYNIFISDYQDYFKSAAKGGRGYCSIHRDFFFGAVKCHDLNELRMTIRSVLDQNAEKADRLPKDPEYIFYRNGLPKTMSLEHIKEVLREGGFFRSVFDTTMGRYNAAVNIHEQYDPMTLIPQLTKDCLQKLCDHISFGSPESPVRRAAGNGMTEKLYEIASDISQLAGRYDLPYIFSAFEEFIDRYMLAGKLGEVKSPGACIRDIVKELIHKPGFVPVMPVTNNRIVITNAR